MEGSQRQRLDGGAGGSNPSLKNRYGSDHDDDPFCIDLSMEDVKTCMRRQYASGKPYLTDAECSSLSTPDDTVLVTPSDIEDREEVNSVCRHGCVCESLYGKGKKRCQDQEPTVEAEVPLPSSPPLPPETVTVTTPAAAASVNTANVNTSSGSAPQPHAGVSALFKTKLSKFKFGTSPTEAEENFNQFRRRAPPGISFSAVAFPSAPKIFWILATHERPDGATCQTRTPYYYEMVTTAAGEDELILRLPITASSAQTQATTQPIPNQKVIIPKRTSEGSTSSSNHETGCAPPPEKKIQTSSSEQVLDSPCKDEEGNGKGFAGFTGKEGKSATSKSNLNNNDAEPLGKVNGSDGLRCSTPGCTFQTVLGFWHLEQHQITCAPNVDNEIIFISSGME